MIRDCKVLLIRVPRNDEGKVVTGGEYRAVIATKENVLLDGDKVLTREWVLSGLMPMVLMSTDYEELFRKQLARNICAWLGFGSVGKFKFNILDKMLGGRDYDIPIEHLQALIEKIKRGEKI
jgi:hypothetical protein